MTISEQVQNDYTNAAGVRRKMVQPAGIWLNDDRVGVFVCPDGIRPVIFLLEVE